VGIALMLKSLLLLACWVQLTPERLVNSPDPATRAFYSARTTSQEIFAARGTILAPAMPEDAK
jgi:hypothetical protein